MYHACKVMKAHECRPIARHKVILQEKESQYCVNEAVSHGV